MVSQKCTALFEKDNHYALDNAPIIAFLGNSTTLSTAQKICDQATESYARKVINWPNGRREKPESFEIYTGNEELGNVDDCIETFVNLLRKALDSATEPPVQNPAEELSVYPHAFIIVDGQNDGHVTLVLACAIEHGWKVEQCLVPVDVELGMAVESLRMGDITEQDLLEQFQDD